MVDLGPGMRDIRDHPLYYPVMLDVSLLLPIVLVIAFDSEQTGTFRASIVGVYVLTHFLIGVVIFRRRYRPRHLSSRRWNRDLAEKS